VESFKLARSREALRSGLLLLRSSSLPFRLCAFTPAPKHSKTTTNSLALIVKIMSLLDDEKPLNLRNREKNTTPEISFFQYYLTMSMQKFIRGSFSKFGLSCTSLKNKDGV